MNVSHVVSSLVCTCSLGPSEGAIFVIARHLLRDSNDNRNERCDRGDSLSPENHKCQHEEMTFMQRCEGAGGSIRSHCLMLGVHSALFIYLSTQGVSLHGNNKKESTSLMASVSCLTFSHTLFQPTLDSYKIKMLQLSSLSNYVHLKPSQC